MSRRMSLALVISAVLLLVVSSADSKQPPGLEAEAIDVGLCESYDGELLTGDTTRCENSGMGFSRRMDSFHIVFRTICLDPIHLMPGGELIVLSLGSIGGPLTDSYQVETVSLWLHTVSGDAYRGAICSGNSCTTEIPVEWGSVTVEGGVATAAHIAVQRVVQIVPARGKKSERNKSLGDVCIGDLVTIPTP